MRVAFLLIVLIHGSIHLIGFLQGFGLKEIKELTLPISRPMAIFWLAAAALFLTYGILHFTHSKFDWPAGLLAVAVSQILIVMFWKDARFGTLPNVMIAVVSVASLGQYRFQTRNQQETAHILTQSKTIGEKIVDENDIRELPEPVKTWLHHAGIVGRPAIRVAKVTQYVEMQMKPGNDWMSAIALQYSVTDPPAFIWTVGVKMNSLLNFHGRDKFENGKGEMLIKLNSLINVVSERGAKLDEGALQRYLGEMVWSPSLAISPYISWEHINDTTSMATMTYKGTTGSGYFHFNARGDVIKFTAMRYKDNDPHARRHEWIMDITDYKTFEGIKVPAKMTSTWKLDEGDWTWLKLEVTDIRYNE